VTLHHPLAEQVVAEALIRMDVDKSASHHQSHTEIAGDNPCSQHLSGNGVPVRLPRITLKLGQRLSLRQIEFLQERGISRVFVQAFQ
jgi:hypothetical protein